MSRKSDSERSQELQDIHNKGEIDKSNGKCEAPHSTIDYGMKAAPFYGYIMEVMDGKGEKEMDEDNSAYYKGQNNVD